jgi:hypothetical protein
MGKHADQDLQRHQYCVERNTDKGALARNAMFFSGAGGKSRGHVKQNPGDFNACILPGGLKKRCCGT